MSKVSPYLQSWVKERPSTPPSQPPLFVATSGNTVDDRNSRDDGWPTLPTGTDDQGGDGDINEDEHDGITEWLTRHEGLDFDDIEIRQGAKRKLGPQLSCLSYRIPYLNIGIMPLAAHALELLAVIVLLLTLLDMGLPQMPGQWLLSGVTAYFVIFAVLTIAFYFVKPTEALTERIIARIRKSGANGGNGAPVRRAQTSQLVTYYRMQLRYAENDMKHLNTGCAWYLVYGAFYWAWYLNVLGSNPDIVCSSRPNACRAQTALTTILLVLNYTLLTNNFDRNKISMAELAGKKVVSLSRTQ